MEKIQKSDYQIEKAKIAIASGGIQGVGPGKVFKRIFYHNHLPISFLLLLLKNMV
jgi:cell division protein FtsW (lipid II flippase)